MTTPKYITDIAKDYAPPTEGEMETAASIVTSRLLKRGIINGQEFNGTFCMTFSYFKRQHEEHMRRCFNA